MYVIKKIVDPLNTHETNEKSQKKRYKKRFKNHINKHLDKRISQYIVDYESHEDNPNNDSECDTDEEEINEKMKILMLNISAISNDSDVENIEGFFTSFGPITQNADTMATDLTNRAFTHSIKLVSDFTINVDTKISIVDPNTDPFAYIATERYTANEFYGIMIDTGASKRFTVDYGQFLTYSKDNNGQIFINTENVEAVHVQFEIDSISFMRSINVTTFIRSIEFHVVKIDTPFLLCLADMNCLKVYYNNIKNILTSNNMFMPVIRRFDHSFLLWEKSLRSYITDFFDHNPCYLIDTKLRQLHRRFGHSFALKLRRILERFKHEDDLIKTALNKLTEYCTFCQKHEKSPERFKFILRENVNFNYFIIVDIMYINNELIFHVNNKIIRFQSTK